MRGAPRQPSLTRRIFFALALATTTVTLVVFATMAWASQELALRDADAMLASECMLVSGMLEDSSANVARLAGLGLGDERVTLVFADGTVAYDSAASAQALPNHALREEVAEARETGEGASVRESDTVGYVSVYHARRLADGSVLRMSADRRGATALLAAELPLALGVIGVVIAGCWVASRTLAARLVSPVLELDPASPDPDASYAEIAPLVRQIAEQRSMLAAQVEELREAGRMRREFTANVTHELKTPLASISGAAELISAGIARPKDVPEFAERILDEAKRMTALVNDILTLSRLDESERAGDRALVGAEQTVDLHRVALDVVRHLEHPAEAAGVTLVCEGESAQVTGVPRLLDELIYNLCDNAIRYNHAGGRVSVWVGHEAGAPVVRVSDTGTGIAPEQQAKVFERFYRVDKSRSRAMGGTGLGLAIVKHAATFHGASIELESALGEGTTITVRFPQG